MGSSTDTSMATNIHNQSPAPSLCQVVVTPCAACKILRRRCGEKCILAPYFPPTEPLKFTTAHRVFGASNITKMLQELPESQRVDAVSSMVYEANWRIRNPVYGCAGTIYQLQKQVGDLQALLAKCQAEIISMQCQQAHFVGPLCMEMKQSSLSSLQQDIDDFMSNKISTQSSSPDNNFDGLGFGEANTCSEWEPSLWTRLN
ncbi:LOB domain-containing protein 1-like [Papaver somniferum]|uniref:LOB domain-containing protein 1-like n=1 Tax=Papaver somniferum TaxID=3469 RepID=UPI000E7041DD|nr:LOB domain-containing protein 1-like [Papaver somniferum]